MNIDLNDDFALSCFKYLRTLEKLVIRPIASELFTFRTIQEAAEHLTNLNYFEVTVKYQNYSNLKNNHLKTK